MRPFLAADLALETFEAVLVALKTERFVLNYAGNLNGRDFSLAELRRFRYPGSLAEAVRRPGDVSWPHFYNVKCRNGNFRFYVKDPTLH